MSDWNRFLECAPWYAQPDKDVVVGAAAPWTRGEAPGLPRLSALLASARVTPVSVAGRSHELLAWDSDDGFRGWLCEPPQDAAGPDFLRRLWPVFGGIVEQVGGPRTPWRDQVEVLTVSGTRTSVSDFVSAYAWAWEAEGLTA